MNQHPLIPLVFSVILTLLMLKQCLSRKKILKVRLFLAFFLSFVSAMLLAFYGEIQKIENGVEYLNWVLLALDIVIGIIFITFSELSSMNAQFTQDLLSTLQKTKFYVLIDRKNRVKEISDLFLNDLDLEEDEAYKKNLFDLIEQKYQITGVNGTQANARDLNIYYKDAENRNLEMNLTLVDKNGDEVAYYLAETMIMTFGKFRGRLFVGEKKSSESLIGMERNLAESSEELDIIKSRFGTILDKTKDGIFFNNLTEKTIWLNDNLVEDLSLTENDLTFQAFMANIHPDDQKMYQAKINQVNNLNPNYSISYRYNIGSRYAYVKEDGSRITNGKTIELCGVIRVLDNYRFEKTKTELDGILGEAEMLAQINNLYKNGKTFEVVLIKMSSIPEINESYGRNIGNISLSEYIKLIRNRYVDANMIYRITGLEFVAVITDYRKMEQLKNALNNKEKILHVAAEYGSTSVKIDVNMGICYSSDGRDAKDIIAKSKETLRFCTNPQFKASFAYYKDIR